MDDCFMLQVLAAALPDPNEDEKNPYISFEMRPSLDSAVCFQISIAYQVRLSIGFETR